MFYLIWFITAWTVWLLLADKGRWREMLPVCVFAVCLAIATDELMHHYSLWEYMGSPLLYHMADDLGIYPAVVYLFIQWMPGKRMIRNMLWYWMAWTSLAITIELIYVHTGHMRYHQWWNTWHSYAVDWVLYWLFYQFHKILRLERLS